MLWGDDVLRPPAPVRRAGRSPAGRGRRAAELGVSLPSDLRAVLAELPGWRIAADEALGRELLAAGATFRRHGHLYSFDLRRNRPSTWDAPPGIRPTDVNRPLRDLST